MSNEGWKNLKASSKGNQEEKNVFKAPEKNGFISEFSTLYFVLIETLGYHIFGEVGIIIYISFNNVLRRLVAWIRSSL